MEKKKNIQSVLHLERLLFDKIEFKRLGFSSENELKLEIQSNIAQRQDAEVYRVTLSLRGNKPEEYVFLFCLTGYFTIENALELSEDLKNTLVTKNATAILMPYLRSEVSLLTAQPGMQCVVIPVLNVNNLLEQ